MQKGIYNIKILKTIINSLRLILCTEELYVFTNYENKKRSVGFKYIYDVDIGTAVQASCSYPGVFSPCTFGKELFS